MTFTWIAEKKDEGSLLREFLREEKGISKKALAHIKFKGGKIEVNGREVNVLYVLNEGDVVSVTYPPEQISDWIVPKPIPLKIEYEDDHLLVINKEPDLPTIPSRNSVENSLASGVIHYLLSKNMHVTFHAINRLDKNTSGLLLVAKHRYIHDLFSQMQREGQVERTYVAIASGVLENDEGTIDAPIAKKETSIIEREVSPQGQRAITHYKVLRRFTHYTFVELKLETGRTHQIRVHMSHLGHPLIGDTLYGGDDRLISRQALHSKTLRFFHPIEKRQMEITSEVAPDMKNVLSLLNET